MVDVYECIDSMRVQYVCTVSEYSHYYGGCGSVWECMVVYGSVCGSVYCTGVRERMRE